MRLLSLLLIFCLSAMPTAAGVKFEGFSPVEKPVVVAPLPLTGPHGKSVVIGKWKGRWLLLNLWATWCAPCVAELPTLQTFAKTSDLAVIAVSMDIGKSGDEINEFLARRKIGSFAAYRDPEHVLKKALNLRSLPMTYLINPQGKIVAVYEGMADWTDPKVTQDLKRRIKAGSTSKTSPTKP